MFIRQKKNRSGSVSVQIVSKARGSYKVVKTIGCGTKCHEIDQLLEKAKSEKLKLEKQLPLFLSVQDEAAKQAFQNLSNSNVQTIGPELVFGRIYDYIGFNKIDEPLFRHLVIARLAFPLSKLKTIEYLYRYQGVSIEISAIYRFLDKLNNQLKKRVEQITFQYTKKTLKNNINVVFYDMTTLHFEASDEDDLRKKGFSKNGLHNNPQIFIGLLVGLGGYPIGYDVFEGNIYEGHTLIPFLEKVQEKFNLGKPIVVADSGLLSNKNIKALEEKDYQYIIGARLRSETKVIQQQITEQTYRNGELKSIGKENNRRLIIHYSDKRAKKDSYNRKKGLQRLEKRLNSGKLTKSNINNNGYNKYLEMIGEVKIQIDYKKYESDIVWDGLKGYITNSKLSNEEVLENYQNLWHIEQAFRMSKTDLKIRPIYHRLKHRIEAHICIAFTAYAIYKELERVLQQEGSTLSLKRASEITHNMYQISFMLPESKQQVKQLLNMDIEQKELFGIISKNF